MRRVLIYGVCGSGKTTLARRLSEATGIRWYEVDQLTWEPGWVMVLDDVQRDRIKSVTEQDTWILDTAYNKWKDLPLDRADTIVALDYPRWVSLTRLVRRCVLRASDKQPVCNGNVESWRNMFSKDSIVVWHFKSFRRKRQRIAEWSAKPEGKTVVVLKSTLETENWLRTLVSNVRVDGAEDAKIDGGIGRD